jgi:hypothetical protein
MMDNKKLALDISSKILFTPTDDRILVKPLKPTMITKLLPTPPAIEPQSVEEAENAEPTQPTKQKVEANIMKGVIIKLGAEYDKVNTDNYEVGDIVFYHRSAGVAFELLKDARMLRRYELMGLEKAA